MPKTKIAIRDRKYHLDGVLATDGNVKFCVKSIANMWSSDAMIE